MPATPFDLKLIPVLQAMVTHRSATRAGTALSMSQPQVSRALARLREQTGDVLFTRTPNGMEPTQTALSLAAAFETAMTTAASLIAAKRTFDAGSTTATFRLSMNDYESAVLLPPLMNKLLADTPAVRLAVVSQRPADVPAALLDGRIELAIGRFTDPGETLRQKVLFDEAMVAVVRRGHPLARGKVSLDRFVAYPHALVAPGGLGDFSGLVDDALQQRGASRQVRLSVSHFLVAPLVASRSDMVVAMPERLLERVSAWGLRRIDSPLPLPGFRISMLWRERSHREPAHRWLRLAVQEAVTGSRAL